MGNQSYWVLGMTVKDKRFYQEMGNRIADFRKAQGLTQQQLAESLGISQQTMAHYEGGRLRVAVAMLPPLAHALAVTFDELMGKPVHKKNAMSKRGPAPILQQQIEQISKLPRSKQKFVIDMLDTVIQRAS